MREQKVVHPNNAKIDDASLLGKPEEPKSRREKLAGMDAGQRISYFLDYYAKPLLLAAVIAGLLVCLAVNYFSQKEFSFSVMAVNADHRLGTQADDAEYYADFLSSCGYDPGEVEVTVSSDMRVPADGEAEDEMTMYDRQVILTRFLAQDIDVFFADEEYFSDLAEQGYFADLRDYLSEEVLAAHEDELFYTTADTGEEYPAGLVLPAGNAWLTDSGWYENGALFGIAAGSANGDLSAAFALEVLGENES